MSLSPAIAVRLGALAAVVHIGLDAIGAWYRRHRRRPAPDLAPSFHQKGQTMPNPLLKRSAFARLASIALIATLAFAPRLARCDEAAQFPCGPIDKAVEFAKTMGGGDFVTLTNDQFQFVRGLFVMAPDTPASLPPGDHAEMSLRPDGSGIGTGQTQQLSAWWRY
jgi:hypothetical protein